MFILSFKRRNIPEKLHISTLEEEETKVLQNVQIFKDLNKGDELEISTREDGTQHIVPNVWI
jgi:hypothetical protein